MYRDTNIGSWTFFVMDVVHADSPGMYFFRQGNSTVLNKVTYKKLKDGYGSSFKFSERKASAYKQPTEAAVKYEKNSCIRCNCKSIGKIHILIPVLCTIFINN